LYISNPAGNELYLRPIIWGVNPNVDDTERWDIGNPGYIADGFAKAVSEKNSRYGLRREAHLKYCSLAERAFKANC